MDAALSGQLAAAARLLQAQPGTQRTLDRSARLATEILNGCDHAGVSIVHRDRPTDTPAATDDVVRRADQLEYDTGEGPCMDAIRQQETVHSPDLASDDRWPRWAPQVAEQLEVGSMLCFQMYTTGKSLAALNPYSNTVDGFNNDDLTAGTFLAAHVAVALAESRNADNLHSSGISRTIIGQAQGTLMERYDLDAENKSPATRSKLTATSRTVRRRWHREASNI